MTQSELVEEATERASELLFSFYNPKIVEEKGEIPVYSKETQKLFDKLYDEQYEILRQVNNIQ